MRHVNINISLVLDPHNLSHKVMGGEKFSSNLELGERFIEALDYQTSMSFMEYQNDSSESKSGIDIMENYSDNPECKKVRVIFSSYHSNIEIDNDSLKEIIPDISMNFISWFDQNGFEVDGSVSCLIYDSFMQLQHSIEYSDITKSIEYVLNKDRSNNLRDFEKFDKEKDFNLMDGISKFDLMSRFKLRDIDFGEDE